jgi:hypothetical protein
VHRFTIIIVYNINIALPCISCGSVDLHSGVVAFKQVVLFHDLFFVCSFFPARCEAQNPCDDVFEIQAKVCIVCNGEMRMQVGKHFGYHGLKPSVTLPPVVERAWQEIALAVKHGLVFANSLLCDQIVRIVTHYFEESIFFDGPVLIAIGLLSQCRMCKFGQCTPFKCECQWIPFKYKGQ